MLDKIRTIDICQSPNIQPLLLRIERSQLRCFDHVSRMIRQRTAKQLMNALPSGKRPRGRPRTRWRNYVKDLAWSRLEIPPAELLLVSKDRDAWRSQLDLLPPKTQKDKRAKGNKLN